MNPEWEVTVDDVKQNLGQGNFVLLDVRTPGEHATAKIDGAVLVPLDQLASRVGELQTLSAGKTVVAHCHHGGRSLKAAQILRGLGIPGVKSMAGGIDVWSQRVDAAVPRY